MTISISNQMRIRIEAAAVTLHPKFRDQFKHAVMGTLASGPQPPGMNETLRSITMALEMVPVSGVLISQSVGDTNDEDDNRRRWF
jgi:hypothetical protein